MSEDAGNPEEIGQLQAERDAADRRYSAALSALDGAVPRLGAAALPPGQPLIPRDRPQPWELMRPAGGGSGLRRVAALLRRLMRLPYRLIFPWQHRFNQAVADHARSMDAAVTSLHSQMDAIARFHHQTIQYAQQVSAYVDTKYRHQLIVGSGVQIYEDVNAVHAMRWEAMMARDRRFTAALDEIRTSIATVQQTGVVLKRELERMLAAGTSAAPAAGTAVATVSSGPPAAAPAATGTGVRTAANPDALNAYKYVGFEHKYRGSEDDIHERLAGYLPTFSGASDVLDLGCGRGEFLAALGAAGIRARGLDINHEMVELCRGRGLTVDEGDALAFVEGLPDGSLGGVFAAQVVEHFQPGYLMRLLDVAFHKLRPGSAIVLETLNPACWSAFFDSYIRDVTHAWPLHPETLKHLVTTAGYQRIEVRYLSPYPPEDKLQRLPAVKAGAATWVEASVIETFNDNVDRLNAQLFSDRDYAVIGRRL